MPIYLCLPGYSSKEPWRHGTKIYDRPRDLNESDDGGKATTASDNNATSSSNDNNNESRRFTMRSVSDSSDTPSFPGGGVSKSTASATDAAVGSIRRARHAEVLLADSILYSHNRHWLRLRWPGPQGGLGGFVALESCDVDELKKAGVAVYPSSESMKLLEEYDDGLGVVGEEEGESVLEPVFCRICREGLHDVNYDEPISNNNKPTNSSGDLSDSETGTTSNEPSAVTSRNEAAARSSLMSNDDSVDTVATSSLQRNDPPVQQCIPCTSPSSSSSHKLPPLVLHHPTVDNPLIAPCKCTGSMAFVHYLCIEQWRCRSRHPDAKDGLNCETCKSPYTLPPPPSRPSRNNVLGEVMGEDEWIEAMPPHVLAALRRPHPWWQIGAAAVRRRWLRPFVPVLISPLVALYCKARRTLKKRGVSRRRWACSLCRRRARWKCVRCLRSYYCSRQCQNVSWHIVHKHVCYKPGRFWWSVVVYALGILVAVPGILKDLLLYDLMLTLIPINFLSMGFIAGGFASTIKFHWGADIRGRMLELAVVFFTVWLTILSSGLVLAFFGDTSKCAGFAPPLGSAIENIRPLSALLNYSEMWYKKWDYVFGKLGFISNKILCISLPEDSTDYSTVGCSPSIRNINPDFYLGDEGQFCRADLVVVMGFWMSALAFVGAGHLDRYLRDRRAAELRRRERPHQD